MKTIKTIEYHGGLNILIEKPIAQKDWLLFLFIAVTPDERKFRLKLIEALSPGAPDGPLRGILEVQPDHALITFRLWIRYDRNPDGTANEVEYSVQEFPEPELSHGTRKPKAEAPIKRLTPAELLRQQPDFSKKPEISDEDW
jgi:hypothetical protein